ncbi:unnamed protein product [Pocillopora meandrina]|uniref:Uncharacterized protein n=1 Tax=Pocillopora meandrina TaxID=46732 RepID=A0AAU9VN43_9CNID|nr:unnamed protein product [Pocillopora meandrina]
MSFNLYKASGRTQLFNVCESFAQNGLRTSPDAKSTNYVRPNGEQSSRDRSKEGQEKRSGSQTEDNESCGGCRNMANTLTEMNLDAQAKRISELEKGVNNLTKSASFEKERAIKLDSHSRRNNLIFFGIPEEVNETSAKTESLLYSFLGDELKLKEDDIDGISIEHAHRLGKRNANDEKPDQSKNKGFILSNARILAGAVFGILQDFSREIVEILRGLVKVLKEAKREGSDAKLIYDKLYINGQKYIPRS